MYTHTYTVFLIYYTFPIPSVPHIGLDISFDNTIIV